MSSLEIIFIRHSHSCGNAREFSTKGKIYKLLRLQTLNPQISDLGVIQIDTAKKAVNDRGMKLDQFLNDSVDYVFCSDFMRAMETAYRLFPSRTIDVLPYIGEKSAANIFVHLNLDLENQSQSPTATLNRIKSTGYDPTHFDYDVYKYLTGGTMRDRGPFPSKHKFLKKIISENWMNPNSPLYLFTHHQHVRIAIISHGHFLRDLVAKDTLAPESFWHSTPIFQYKHCQDPNYKPSRPALGNVGMIAMLITPKDIIKHLDHKKKLPRPLYVYETNAVHDPHTGKCLKYNDIRFVVEGGRKGHVSRCGAHIREIPTLLEDS